jgi:phosphoenolpyruvate carboxykinase (GTP)
VNWFRRDADGKFLWPGYSENVRVLKWILERIQGGGEATETAIGNVPTANALDLNGLDMPPARLAEALRVGREDWQGALDELGQFYQTFGDRLPRPIWDAHARTLKRL